MKKTQCFSILMLAAAASCGAAVPVEWDVEVARVQPAMFSAYRGETLELSARMLRGGRPFEAPLEGAALYWQTNGMGSAYWAAPASCASNVLSAVWSPTNDVGAATYNCFIGVPGGSYRAAFRLRLLDSPGASPNSLPLPAARLDFATVEVANPPYYSKAETEAKIAELAPAPDYSTDNAALVETIHQAEVDPTVPAWAKKTVGDYYSDNLYRLVDRDFYAKNSSINSQASIWLKGSSNPTVTVGRDKLSDNTFPYARQTVLGFSAYEGYDYYAHYRPRGIYIWPWWNKDAQDDIAYLFPTKGNGGTFALTSDIPTVPTEQINAATATNALQDAELESLSDSISTLGTTKADRSELAGYATPADLPYTLGSTITASATLADRTNNLVAPTNGNAAIVLTFPAAVSGKSRDFTALLSPGTNFSGSISFTVPSGATIYGDGFGATVAPGESWLFSVTEIAAGTFYVSAIKMEAQ